MYETIRIVGKLRPKYVLWENVKNLLSKKHKHNFDAYIETMNILGYNSYYEVLNAKNYGIPQNRERVYTISIRKDIDKGNFKFPNEEELKLRLKDMLEDEVEEKYYLSEQAIQGFLKHNENHIEKGTGFIWKPKNENDIASTLRANAALCPTDNTIKVIGNLNIKGQDNIKRVYSDKGISPTLTDMQGGNRQPKILEDFYKNRSIREYDKVTPTLRSERTGLKVIELLKIKNATKKGYDEAIDGDSVNLQYPDSNTRRGRVGHQVSQTIQCNDSMGVVNNFRIRKLTPKECWRLMGFDDGDFEKAKNVPMSNTQLYKQARKFYRCKCFRKNIQKLTLIYKNDLTKM